MTKNTPRFRNVKNLELPHLKPGSILMFIQIFPEIESLCYTVKEQFEISDLMENI